MEFNHSNITLTSNLEKDVESLATELRRVLDTLTPVKNCSVSLKPKKPWFNKELAVEKAKVRRREKKWLKYSYHQLGQPIKNKKFILCPTK